MLDTNIGELIKISVIGEIANPSMSPLPASPYIVSGNGEPLLVPSYGGLVYSIRVGDRALGWAAELLQPGVSIKHPDSDVNTALATYACLGNEARAVTGRAAGAVGTVVGKSGRFAEHVICDFSSDDMERMSPGDKIQIKAYGIGLKFLDFPDVHLKSCSPDFLQALVLSIRDARELEVPVMKVVPGTLTGAGAGFSSESRVVNLESPGEGECAGMGLDELRFGDLVAVTDWDSRFSQGYQRGAISVGVVSQGGSFRSGYGPGITIFMTSRADIIEPVVVDDANIADRMGLV